MAPFVFIVKFLPPLHVDAAAPRYCCAMYFSTAVWLSFFVRPASSDDARRDDDEHDDDDASSQVQAACGLFFGRAGCRSRLLPVAGLAVGRRTVAPAAP